MTPAVGRLLLSFEHPRTARHYRDDVDLRRCTRSSLPRTCRSLARQLTPGTAWIICLPPTARRNPDLRGNATASSGNEILDHRPARSAIGDARNGPLPLARRLVGARPGGRANRTGTSDVERTSPWPRTDLRYPQPALVPCHCSSDGGMEDGRQAAVSSAVACSTAATQWSAPSAAARGQRGRRARRPRGAGRTPGPEILPPGQFRSRTPWTSRPDTPA